jgi:phosphohistidine phosphatase
VRLWLLRHAKSSWDDVGLADIDRPLAPRGERAARSMAVYLRTEAIHPELVLCSPAARARGTLDLVLPSLGAPEVLVGPELYTFEPEPVVERLRAIPGGVGSAMLVGHNPAMQALAVWLARSGERLDELRAKVPTGALAELELDGPAWADVAAGSAVLTRFVPPRELP